MRLVNLVSAFDKFGQCVWLTWSVLWWAASVNAHQSPFFNSFYKWNICNVFFLVKTSNTSRFWIQFSGHQKKSSANITNICTSYIFYLKVPIKKYNYLDKACSAPSSSMPKFEAQHNTDGNDQQYKAWIGGQASFQIPWKI